VSHNLFNILREFDTGSGKKGSFYSMSPPLVVAFAMAGTMFRDLENEPLGIGSKGEDVFLRDIWPAREEVSRTAGPDDCFRRRWYMTAVWYNREAL